MRLENMEQAFPEMPEDMRKMVESEVAKQMGGESADRCVVQLHRSRRNARRVFAASLAAVMLLGTTVFGSILYQMHAKSIGKYGVEVKTERNGSSIAGDDSGTPGSSDQADAAGTMGAEQAGVLSDIPTVRMEVSYLPKGMVEQGDPGRYGYEDNPYEGGVTLGFYRMDTGDDAFEMLQGDVVSSEEITLNGHSGVYLEYQNLFQEENTFNQRIYLAYTDVHYVMEMFIGANVPKEEALKMAESVTLTAVDDGTAGDDIVSDYSWSEHLASEKESMENTGELDFMWMQAKKSDLKHTHKLDENFTIETTGNQDGVYSDQVKVETNVTDVQTSDDINLLDMSKLQADEVKKLEAVTDADGRLLPAELQYVKNGNGVDSVSEIAETRNVPQKLLYVTVEYTNTGDKVLSDVLYTGSLMKIAEKSDSVRMYTREEKSDGKDWDQVYCAGPAGFTGMWYYDVSGGERGNNYIPEIKPGETVTVHLAWIVPEEELKYCYLNLDPWGGAYQFDEHALSIGYVDIRCWNDGRSEQ